MIQECLNKRKFTPITDPETVIGRVMMINFSSIKFFVFDACLFPKLEYIEATVPPSKKI